MIMGKHWMKTGAALAMASSLALMGCATSPALDKGAASREALMDELPAFWADEVFAQTDRARAKAAEAMMLSPAMEDMARRTLEPLAQRIGGPEAMYSVLYERGRISVEYSSDYTRNASEAFQARRGNCLSLALMTAAFAKRLGVRAHYQLVRTPDAWSRGDRLNFQVRHVNVTLVGNVMQEHSRGTPFGQGLTVDFIPTEYRNRETVRELSEATVVAMYLNNLASEAMDDAHYDQAYALIKEALRMDPAQPDAYNTLAVVLSSRGQQRKAEAALRRSLALAPEGLAALGNLAALLDGAPHASASARQEAQLLRGRLRELQPRPPFADMDEGLLALAAGDAARALAAFQKQKERTGEDARLQQYLAAAHAKLGQMEEARAAVRQGIKLSESDGQRQQLFAKKRALMQPASLKAE